MYLLNPTQFTMEKTMAKLRNTRNFVDKYINGKTGQFVLSRGYGRNEKQKPKVMAHAFKEALDT